MIQEGTVSAVQGLELFKALESGGKDLNSTGNSDRVSRVKVNGDKTILLKCSITTD